MEKKTCPYCSGDSYSASWDEWICPYCGVDLSRIDKAKEEKDELKNKKKKAWLYRIS